MKPAPALLGIVPIVVTPFDEDNHIDVVSLHRLLDDYCANDAAATVVPAVASEVDKLSLEERQFIVRETAAALYGRLPVVGGVFANNGTEAAHLAEAALKAGCAGILCRAPASLQGEALKQYFIEVAAAGMDFLVIQDLSWNEYGMELNLIVELFNSIDAFQAIKIEVVRTGFKATEVLEATGHKLNVWSGWAMLQMIETLDRGVTTYNPSAYNRPFVAVCERHRNGDRAEAVRLFEQVLPYLAWGRQHSDINLQLLKHYCVRRGLFNTPRMRQPVIEYDAYHERFGAELVERMLAWDVEAKQI